MAKIFISYARKDKDEVYPIVDELEKNGFDYWIDKNGIESGEQFKNIIMDAIDGCEIFLYMLSANTLASTWCSKEYNYANGFKKIIPILLKGAKENRRLMFDFSTMDCIDIYDNVQKEKLIRDLKKWACDTSIKVPSKSASESIENIKGLEDNLLENSNEIVNASNSNKASGNENYIKGVKLFEQGDYLQAIIFLEKAIEQRNVEAHNKLGQCYSEGLGVNQDQEKAFKLFSYAAEQGNADAQYRLGHCYFNRNGVKQDYAQAVSWYRKAADQGNADAQHELGICYESGKGVNQNYKQAVFWWGKAADQNHSNAQHTLGDCYYFEKGVEQDYKQAVDWYRKAALQGHAKAQYRLGHCYYYEKGVKQDYTQAVYWYRKAAEQGDDEAKKKLATIIK